jgi:hypothetical protein
MLLSVCVKNATEVGMNADARKGVYTERVRIKLRLCGGRTGYKRLDNRIGGRGDNFSGEREYLIVPAYRQSLDCLTQRGRLRQRCLLQNADQTVAMVGI